MQAHFRTATAEEIGFYRKKLYPVQDYILSLCSEYQDFYLTGGTALARFYLNHRLSDDLDLFIKIRKRDSHELLTFQKRADYYAKDLEGKISRKYQTADPMYGEFYSRFYIEYENFRLKIDIVREYHHSGKLLRTPEGFRINNLKDIAVGKLMAFEDRAEIKDIIDLYYLTQKFSYEELFELAILKRVPIAYENLLTINLYGISGKAIITREIREAELYQFVEELKKQVAEEIKKKENSAMNNIAEIVKKMLWDFPPEDRVISEFSIPVLKRRLNRLPLPEKRALEKLL